jgi:hypothetical protein
VRLGQRTRVAWGARPARTWQARLCVAGGGGGQSGTLATPMLPRRAAHSGSQVVHLASVRGVARGLGERAEPRGTLPAQSSMPLCNAGFADRQAAHVS